ncbi:MAG: hypothetical protein E7159_00715 [Firmicutes bacterium]|nr:hypothetical protein [Bacillota bacterium]
MQEKVELLIDGNDTISQELLSEFEINDGGNVKRFILLTNNDIDQNGLIKILASEIDGGQIKRIDSDDDWTKVKNVMRSIIASSPEPITYINTAVNKSFNATQDHARIIAVQDTAKQAIAKDYFDKRPDVEEAPEVAPAPVVDENANIYPTDNTVAPIGSEIANGISETPVSEPTVENNAPVEDEDAPIQNYEAPAVNDVNLDEVLRDYKEQLMQEVTIAIDKYIDNIKLTIENNELKNIIANLTDKNS